MTAPDAPAKPPVGLLLLSHGPLAEALRETIRILEPDEHDDLGALSLKWDEAAEKASRRLEKAIATCDSGGGVVLLTDLFGGTPSNLALAFLEPGRVEIVSGANLPMLIKARALAREGRSPREIAHTLVERGRRAILAAAELAARDAEELRLVEETLTLKNRLGLHARAAAKLVHTASSFASRITLARDGDEVDGKSILGLLLLAAGKGTSLLVRAEGADEAAALAAIRELIDRRFDESD